MPEKKQTYSLSYQPKRNPILLIIFIIILVLIIIFAIIILNTKSKQFTVELAPASQTQNQIEQKNFNEKIKTNTKTFKEIPKEIFSYIGEITKISNNQIIINAKENNNNLLEDKLLTINFSENIVFSKIIIPKILTGDKEKDKITKQDIEKSDLKIKQTILVVSDENIANKTEFTVSKIEVQEIRE